MRLPLVSLGPQKHTVLSQYPSLFHLVRMFILGLAAVESVCRHMQSSSPGRWRSGNWQPSQESVIGRTAPSLGHLDKDGMWSLGASKATDLASKKRSDWTDSAFTLSVIPQWPHRRTWLASLSVCEYGATERQPKRREVELSNKRWADCWTTINCEVRYGSVLLLT